MRKIVNLADGKAVDYYCAFDIIKVVRRISPAMVREHTPLLSERKKEISMEQKTPLYDCHLAAKGKIVPFAGFLLPVQYEAGVIAEHMAVREKAGLFDVSHMAEMTLCGKDAMANVQMLVTNQCGNMVDGQVKYTTMCYENGTTVDDLLVYKTDEEHILLVVNAANHEKDVEWIRSHLFGDVEFKDISDDVAQVALQGPKSLDIIRKLADESTLPTKYYTFVPKCTVAGKECLVSRTGYTGEFGYEIYCAPADAAHIWNALLEAGKEFGLLQKRKLFIQRSFQHAGVEIQPAQFPVQVVFLRRKIHLPARFPQNLSLFLLSHDYASALFLPAMWSAIFLER